MSTVKGKKKRSGVRLAQSITGKLILAIVGSVLIAVAALLLIVYVNMSGTLLAKSEELLETTTDRTVQETSAWLNKTLTTLEMERDTVQYQDMDVAQMREYVHYTEGKLDSCPAGLYIGLLNGTLLHATFEAGADYSTVTRPWYKDGLQSEAFIIGDVYFDQASQSIVVGASGVLKSASGRVRGVAAGDITLDSVTEIVKDITLEQTGGIFLVDTRTGTIIGHREADLVSRNLSEFTDGIYSYVAQQLEAKTTGLSIFENTYIQVEMVPGCDWAAVAYVSRDEVLSDLITLAKIMIALALLALVVITLLVSIQVRRIIGKPVAELSGVATRIAEGELDQAIHHRSNDELGVLANNFNQVTVRLRDYVAYIDEIAKTLHEIAEGNLTFSLTLDYAGEFAKIKSSLENISTSLNGTMGQLKAASRDVAVGAEQVSNGAMSLSQGSTEQAAEVDALAGHIDSISKSIHQVAQLTQDADKISQDVKTGLLSSNEKMRNLTVVIQKTSDKSAEIHKIVKTIEDIAFQTNILALNAAVEAARAGAAGKGFAVVADEVRNLAKKSSEAAQATSQLLSQTVDSMSDGVAAAEETAQSMLAVVKQADAVSKLISGIAEDALQQSTSAEEITNGVEQIGIVVQNNVATAEASAAASEELSGQAAMLKDLVAQFRLKE